jgi:hypothetical protein
MVGVRIPQSLREKINELALASNTTVSNVIRVSLENQFIVDYHRDYLSKLLVATKELQKTINYVNNLLGAIK